jgi:hypothetical protein
MSASDCQQRVVRFECNLFFASFKAMHTCRQTGDYTCKKELQNASWTLYAYEEKI